MRILYAGMKNDYGDPSRGLSFEHTNMYDSLARMGHEIIYFDFMTEFQQRGRQAMSNRLVDIAHAEKPDLLFCILFTDQFDIDRIRYISEKTEVTTFNWFCDDHWRFDSYSRHWAPAFNWVSTTATSAMQRYRKIGYNNVIKTQWACNHLQYRPLDLPLKYDVTFVGQPHGNRKQTIAALRRAGIDVQTWGYGWDHGRAGQEEMIAIFNQSKINLNLSNASTSGTPWSIGRWLGGRSRRLPSQIKGRNFEVPGCGAFLLTEPADDLSSYYEPGREVGIFSDPSDLIPQIRYFLENDSVRSTIADGGYRRTLASHTYIHRFNDIFAQIGLCLRPSLAS